jgi:hypothetical protein
MGLQQRRAQNRSAGLFPKKERRKGDHSLISFSRFWMNPLRIAT